MVVVPLLKNLKNPLSLYTMGSMKRKIGFYGYPVLGIKYDLTHRSYEEAAMAIA